MTFWDFANRVWIDLVATGMIVPIIVVPLFIGGFICLVRLLPDHKIKKQ